METILSILFLIYTNNFDFYKDIKIIYNPTTYDFIVNKNIKLEKDYIPSDLEIINNKYSLDNKYLRHKARISFEKMASDALLENLHIIAVSAYRSYSYQENLYNNYVKEKGYYYADLCSARAGHSEHQTGLAIDIADKSYDYDNFYNTKEYLWVRDNAHKYGFILRYPISSYHITGFKFEPWHIRYVGNIANIIYENNLTLEEYKKNNIN